MWNKTELLIAIIWITSMLMSCGVKHVDPVNVDVEKESVNEKEDPYKEFFDALASVESSGMDSPPDGDGGKAIGPFQIWEVYWIDATEYDKSFIGGYSDCRDRKYAERVVMAYMQRYAYDAWENRDWETCARIHNGGPRGNRKISTNEYWYRFEKALSAHSGAP